jgi:hypothetical protein
VTRLAAAAAGLALVLALAGEARTAAPAGTWRGTFAFGPTTDAVPFSVELRGARATVVMGGFHPVETAARAVRTGNRVRFVVPGRPTPLRFDGRLRGRLLSGRVTHAGAAGTFRLRRGTHIDARLLGLYAIDGGRVLAVAENAFAGRTAVAFDDGEVRKLTRVRAGAYEVGAGFAVRGRAAGELRFSTGGSVVGRFGAADVTGRRVALRQEEVRLRGRAGWLAGTLTLPPGDGPHPAVVFAHGAGETRRDVLSTFSLFYAAHGVATLALDKRGVGLSGGAWPGESASETAIHAYARDVEAGARFLAAQPDVDRTRIGVSGASQAGWIMPLAASREPSIRFMVGLVSPTLSQGQTDLWADRAGKGAAPPAEPIERIDADVAALTPFGFDPMPAIRALGIPAVWIFAAEDRTVPTRLSVAALAPVAAEAGRDFTSIVLPRAGHGLLEARNGLSSEAAVSPRFAAGLWTTMRDWLVARGVAAG